MAKSLEQMIEQVENMPASQWFTVRSVNDGEHSPELWKRLCYMDYDHYVRGDGATLVSRNSRLEFMWSK